MSDWTDDSHPYFLEEDLDYWVDFESAQRDQIEADNRRAEEFCDRIDAELAYDQEVAAERSRMAGDEPTTVYRFYDSDSRLLYVGVSKQIPIRLRSHNSEKPWWLDAAWLTFEHFASRPEALAAEAAAIVAEDPLYNIQGRVRS